MLKRLLVAASLSALAVVGPVSVASADASPTTNTASSKARPSQSTFGTLHIPAWSHAGWVVDEEDSGGYSTQRIDWD